MKHIITLVFLINLIEKKKLKIKIRKQIKVKVENTCRMQYVFVKFPKQNFTF